MVRAPEPVVIAPIPGYDEFEIDLESVLRKQLPALFDRMDAAPLTSENVNNLPQGAKGAYLLFHRNTPVYAGKTDTRHGFRSRLSRHFKTLRHRRGIAIDEIGFKAVRVMVFSNFDLEAILIEELRRRSEKHIAWNDSGFGSNDPGRNRDGQKPAKFDLQYPIDIDEPLENINAGSTDLFESLGGVKSGLPYLFRYETAGKGVVMVDIPNSPITMRHFLKISVEALPGWQATIFPNRVILYRERVDYKFATEYIR